MRTHSTAVGTSRDQVGRNRRRAYRRLALSTAAAAGMAGGVGIRSAHAANPVNYAFNVNNGDFGVPGNFINTSGGAAASGSIYGNNNFIVDNGLLANVTSSDNLGGIGGEIAIGYSKDFSGSGVTAGTTGTLNVSGGTLATSGFFLVGRDALGFVNQTGGTVSGGNFGIGYQGGAGGTYNISGGTLTGASTLIVGGGFGGNVGTALNSTLNLFAGSGTTPTVVGNGFISVGDYNSGFDTLNVSAGSITSKSDFNIADAASSTAALLLSGSGTATGVNVYVGKGTAAQGTLNVSGGTLTASGNLFLGLSGTATANISGGTVTTPGSIYLGNTSTGSATVTVAGGSLNASGGGSTILIGNAASETSTLNLTSGTVSAGFFLDVAAYGTGVFNVGGSGTFTSQYINVADGTGKGTLTVSTGGTVTLSNQLFVGKTGTGVLNLNGGAVTTTNALSIGTNSGAVGTVNLNGGTLTIPNIATGSGTSTFNFNGGSLVASASSTAFMAGAQTVNVLAGGANFNTSTFSDTIARNLVGGAGSGALTKFGTGTLTLSGSNTYAGGTVVNGGTVVSANPAALPGGTALTVAANSGVNFNGQYLRPANSGTPGLTLTSLTAGGGDLFGFNAATAGVDDIAFSGQSAVTGTNTINLTVTPGSTLGTGTYNLFTAPGGLGTSFAFAVNGTAATTSNGTSTSSVTSNGVFYPLTFTSTDTADTLFIGAGQIAKLFYTGNTSNDLTVAGNYSTDAGGMTAATAAPTSITDVVFNANNSNGTVSNFNNPTIGAALSANSLEFTANHAVTVGGSGTITLSAGQNTFAAGTGIVVDTGAGADTIAANLALAASQSFTNNSTNPFTLSGQVAVGSNILTFAGTGPFNQSGVITGTSAVVRYADTGTVTVSGANTYTGGTNVSAGTVVLANAAALGDAGNRVLVSGGTLNLSGTNVTQSRLDLGGGVVGDSVGGGSLALTGPLAINISGGAYGTTPAVSAALSFTAGGAGSVIAKPVGTGNPVLAGPINLNATPVTVALADTPGDSSGELNVTGLVSGTGSLTLANNTNVPGVTFSNQSDFGTLYLGNNANNYSGGTNINYGRVAINTAGALGTGPVTVNIGANNASGGTLEIGGDATTAPYSQVPAAGITVANTINLGGAVNGNYGIGLYNFGPNNLSGGVNLISTDARISVASGPLTLTGTVADGPGGVHGGVEEVQSPGKGAGTLVLSGNNTYSGNTTFTAGTFRAGSNAAFGTSTLVFNGGTIGSTTAVALNNNMVFGPTQAINLSQTSPITFNGSLTVAANGSSSIVATGSPAAVFNGAILGGSATSTLNLTGFFSILGGTTLSGSNYTGFTQFNSGTSIPIDDPGAFSTSTLEFNGGGFDATGAGFPFVTGGALGPVLNNYTFGAAPGAFFNGAQPFELSGNGTLPAGTNPIANTPQVTLSGPISGPGGLSKVFVGTSTLVLTGNNTYAGGTTVSAGTIRVNNTAGSGTGTGPVTIASGGTLGGSGTIQNSTGSVVAVNSGGTITAGPDVNTIGTLTTNAQAWNGGGTYLAKTDGTTLDRLIMSSLTLPTSGTFSINVTTVNGSSGAAVAPFTTLVLATDTDPTSANPFSTGTVPASLMLNVSSGVTVTGGGGFTLGEQADMSLGGYDLVLVSAPEPTSLLLMGVAAAPLALGRRRRRATLATA